MRKHFKDTMLELAAKYERIVLVFGDISVFLFNQFVQQFPERFFNLGICEQALISVCAGLSSQGFIPFAHSINPFITERCYEQIKLDMAYNDFGGNIVSCGATFDYAWDGPSHQTFSELAMLRRLPGLEIIQPGSPQEFDQLLRSQYANGKTTYFRLSDHNHGQTFPVRFGQAVVLKDVGAPLTVLTAGPILGNCLAACQERPVNLVYFHTIKPLDSAVLERFRHTHLVIVHDAHGLHDAVVETPGLTTSYHGLKDQFPPSYGTVQDLRRENQLDIDGIGAALDALLSHSSASPK